jgi:hypothetical protein
VQAGLSEAGSQRVPEKPACAQVNGSLKSAEERLLCIKAFRALPERKLGSRRNYQAGISKGDHERHETKGKQIRSRCGRRHSFVPFVFFVVCEALVSIPVAQELPPCHNSVELPIQQGLP